MASLGFGFLHLCLLLCIFSNSVSANSEKVKFSLYYETLCPACSNFMVNTLPKIFDNELFDIVDLNLVPYGNAELTGQRSNQTITCQHGPDECYLNMVEACAIHVSPDVTMHYTFLYCIESLVLAKNYTDWESCYQKTGFNPAPISDCILSGKGQKLEFQYANETNSLKPPRKFVPWVVVNDFPLRENYDNFVTYVCKAYKGSSLPKACTG